MNNLKNKGIQKEIYPDVVVSSYRDKTIGLVVLGQYSNIDAIISLGEAIELNNELTKRIGDLVLYGVRNREKGVGNHG